MQFQGKLMIRTHKNDEKPHFGPDLGMLGPNSGRKKVFSRIWLRQSLDIMVSYHHVQYQKKTDDPILRKLSDGQTDGQTDGQSEESDFIGRCPTNVERLIMQKFIPDETITCGDR